MSAVVAGGMLLPPADLRIADWRIRTRLPNPANIAWQRHGKGWEPDRWVVPLTEMDDGPWKGGVVVPRFAPGVAGADRMTLPAASCLSFGATLRDYQRAAVHAVLDHFAAEEAREAPAGLGAMIQAPCGGGKTEIGCALMAEVHTPALVLVHTQDLALQWRDRIKLRLGVDAALVGYGKKGDGSGARIAVASLQTLARWGWWRVHQWGKQWGMVVLDEAHHGPAQTFCGVLAGLSGRVRVGLTATPERADGLTPWLGWLVGPTVAKIDPAVIEGVGATLAPEVRVLRVPGAGLDGLESHERDRVLAESVTRNCELRAQARRAVAEGRRVLVLVKLVAHARALAQALCARGVDAVALVGECPKKDREATIARMRAGTVEVVVATSLADEGLDAPRLDTVILGAPSGDLGKVEQRIGRVCRPHPEAQPPRVVDVVDAWGPLQGYARRRAKLYRERGWRVA